MRAAGYSDDYAQPLFGDWWTRVAPAGRLYDFMFPDAPFPPHGSYTVGVAAQPDVQTAQWRQLKGGPWTFHFNLP